MQTYQVLNTKFRQDGIWWKRTTTYERNRRIGVSATLGISDNDKSVERLKPDHEKCCLCRVGKSHTVDLHTECVETGYEERTGYTQQQIAAMIDNSLSQNVF